MITDKGGKVKNLLIILSICVLSIESFSTSYAGASGATEAKWSPYLEEGWPTIHGDSANSDYSSFELIDDSQADVSVLKGRVSLTSQVLDEKRKVAYVTVFKRKAEDAVLYAYAINGHSSQKPGTILWHSKNWGLTDEAVASSPLIDDEGNVYISDKTFVYKVNAEGELLWKKNIYPKVIRQPEGFFLTMVFTPSGHVGGVTSQGLVIFFNMENGERAPTLQLKGLISQRSKPASERKHFVDVLQKGSSLTEKLIEKCLWVDENDAPMMLQDRVAIIKDALQGSVSAIANTPAILKNSKLPNDSHLFIQGTLNSVGPKGYNNVRLFRVDIKQSSRTGQISLSLANSFNGIITDGGYSATSPTISPDNKMIVIGDMHGMAYGIDPLKGSIKWKTDVGEMAGSLSIARSGLNKLISFGTYDIKAIDHMTGKIAWTKNYHDYASKSLKQLTGAFKNAARKTLIDGNVISTPHYIIFPILLGHHLIGDVPVAFWPMQAQIITVDRRSGNIVGKAINLPDTSELLAKPDRDGSLHVGFASITSSLTHCLYRQMGEEDNVLSLPEPIRPRGGVGSL